MSDAPWRDCTLEDLVNMNPEALGGSTPPRSRFRYIDINSVTLGKIDWQSVPEVEFRSAPSRARRIVRSGDTMFCTVRPSLQAHAYAVWNEPEGFICSTGFAVLRPKQADKRFIFHTVFSEAVASHVRRREVGSSYPAVNESDLKQAPLRVPELEVEQSRIAEILDTLDAAIRDAEAVVAKLKQVKAGLLHDLLTRGLDEHGQLRDPARHPEQFQNSPIGIIPKGWQPTTVGDCLRSIEQGWSPDCESIPAPVGSWGILKTTAVVWEGYNEAENKLLPEKFQPLPALEIQPDDILMTRAGPSERVGVVAWVESTRSRLLLSDKLYRLRPKPSVNHAFLTLALSTDNVQRQLGRIKTGLAESQTNISQDYVRRLVTALPKDPDEQLAIVAANGLHQQRLRQESEFLGKLHSLKRGLAHDLLTGRKRVPEVLQPKESKK